MTTSLIENSKRKYATDTKITQNLLNTSGDIGNRIIFGSPFYKKRNQITSKFREFDKVVSDKEIKEYSKRILKHINSNKISELYNYS